MTTLQTESAHARFYHIQQLLVLDSVFAVKAMAAVTAPRQQTQPAGSLFNFM